MFTKIDGFFFSLLLNQIKKKFKISSFFFFNQNIYSIFYNIYFFFIPGTPKYITPKPYEEFLHNFRFELAYRLTRVKPSSGSPGMFVLVLSDVRKKVDLNIKNESTSQTNDTDQIFYD